MEWEVSITYKEHALKTHGISTIHTFAGNIIRYVTTHYTDLENSQTLNGFIDYTDMLSVVGEYEALITKLEGCVTVNVTLDDEIDAITIILSY
jgi:hypothetical protein